MEMDPFEREWCPWDGTLDLQPWRGEDAHPQSPRTVAASAQLSRPATGKVQDGEQTPKPQTQKLSPAHQALFKRLASEKLEAKVIEAHVAAKVTLAQSSRQHHRSPLASQESPRWLRSPRSKMSMATVVRLTQSNSSGLHRAQARLEAERLYDRGGDWGSAVSISPKSLSAATITRLAFVPEREPCDVAFEIKLYTEGVFKPLFKLTVSDTSLVCNVKQAVTEQLKEVSLAEVKAWTTRKDLLADTPDVVASVASMLRLSTLSSRKDRDLGSILRDDLPLHKCIAKLYSNKTHETGRCKKPDDAIPLAVQLLQNPESLRSHELLLSLRRWHVQRKVIDAPIELVVSKYCSGADLRAVLAKRFALEGNVCAEAVPTPLRRLGIARCQPSADPLTHKTAVKLKWKEDFFSQSLHTQAASPEKTHVLTEPPFSLRDGSMLVICDEQDRAAAKATASAKHGWTGKWYQDPKRLQTNDALNEIESLDTAEVEGIFRRALELELTDEYNVAMMQHHITEARFSPAHYYDKWKRLVDDREVELEATPAKYLEQVEASPLVLVWDKSSGLKPEYHNLTLWPTTKRTSNHAVWSAEDESLHLYYNKRDSAWLLHFQFMPEDRGGFATLKWPPPVDIAMAESDGRQALLAAIADGSATLPSDEQLWQVGASMRVERDKVYAVEQLTLRSHVAASFEDWLKAAKRMRRTGKVPDDSSPAALKRKQTQALQAIIKDALQPQKQHSSPEPDPGLEPASEPSSSSNPISPMSNPDGKQSQILLPVQEKKTRVAAATDAVTSASGMPPEQATNSTKHQRHKQVATAQELSPGQEQSPSPRHKSTKRLTVAEKKLCDRLHAPPARPKHVTPPPEACSPSSPRTPRSKMSMRALTRLTKSSDAALRRARAHLEEERLQHEEERLQHDVVRHTHEIHGATSHNWKVAAARTRQLAGTAARSPNKQNRAHGREVELAVRPGAIAATLKSLSISMEAARNRGDNHEAAKLLAQLMEVGQQADVLAMKGSDSMKAGSLSPAKQVVGKEKSSANHAMPMVPAPRVPCMLTVSFVLYTDRFDSTVCQLDFLDTTLVRDVKCALAEQLLNLEGISDATVTIIQDWSFDHEFLALGVTDSAEVATFLRLNILSARKDRDLGKILRDDMPLHKSTKIADTIPLAFRLLQNPEPLSSHELLLSLQLWHVQRKVIDAPIELVVSKYCSGAELRGQLALQFALEGNVFVNAVPTPLRRLGIARYQTSAEPVTHKTAVKLKWNESCFTPHGHIAAASRAKTEQTVQTLDLAPFTLRDGSILVVCDEEDRAAAKAAAAAKRPPGWTVKPKKSYEYLSGARYMGSVPEPEPSEDFAAELEITLRRAVELHIADQQKVAACKKSVTDGKFSAAHYCELWKKRVRDREVELDATPQRYLQQLEASPLVLAWGIRNKVKPEYHDLTMWPTTKRSNGRAVWSAEGGNLHLYMNNDSSWLLHFQFLPDDREGFATLKWPPPGINMEEIRDGSDKIPFGRHMWKVGAAMRQAQLGEVYGTEKLTLKSELPLNYEAWVEASIRSKRGGTPSQALRKRREMQGLQKQAKWGLLKQDDDLTVLVDEVWHTSKPDPEADRLRELLREAMENKVQQFNHTIEDTRQIFRWMDADNSGDLDPTEFRQAILSLGLLRCKHQTKGLCEEDIDGLWNVFDADSDGLVTIEELLAALHV